MDGRRAENLDARVSAYRSNAARVPSVTGHVIPEPVFTQRTYEEELLGRIYHDLAPLDPEGILRHEWVNARGCIARFDRMALEIRLVDIQECPAADLAVVAAIVGAVRAQVEERWSGTRDQRRWDERELEALLLGAVRDGDGAVVENRRVLEAHGYPERGRARLREVWQHLIETMLPRDPLWPEWEAPLSLYLREGCLARRIVDAAGEGREGLFAVYERLGGCLARGELFGAG